MNSKSDFDPYALPASAIKEPPHQFRKAIREIGPGLILAAAIVGTGELINTTSLGAKAGFSLLWLILLSCIAKVFLQVELGRYAITHGRTTMAAFNTLPGPRFGASWLCWLWWIMTLATLAQSAAMEGAIGQTAVTAFPRVSEAIATNLGKIHPAVGEYLKHHQELIWAGATTLAAILLLISGGYKLVEGITTVLVGLVTAYTVASVLILQWTTFQIRFSDIASGFRIFEYSDLEGLRMAIPAAAIPLAFSAFGITGVGAAELCAYPYWCIEKGYARSAGPRTIDDSWARRARGWIRIMQLDAWFSMVVFTVATVAFYFLGAAVLHPQGLDPKGSEMLPILSKMYVEPLQQTPLAGWQAQMYVTFLVGAWVILFKTLYVSTAANARITADFFSIAGIWHFTGPHGRERVVRFICVLYPTIAFTLFWIYREPQLLVKIGGIAQALLLPLIAASVLYIKRRDADARVKASTVSDILTWIATIAIWIVAGYAVYSLIPK